MDIRRAHTHQRAEPNHSSNALKYRTMAKVPGRLISDLPLILDEAGLSDSAILPQRVATMPFRDLQKLLIRASEILSPAQTAAPQAEPPNLGFDFLANSSIKADSFFRECAIDKVTSLARYAH